MNFSTLKIALTAKPNTTQLNSDFLNAFDEAFVQFAGIIAQALGFSYEFLTPENGELGTELPDGNWTGIIGLIQRHEADLAVSILSISPQRAKVVDFIYPFQRSRITFATRKAKYRSEPTAFLKPYSIPVWLSVVVCLVTIPFLLRMLFQRKQNFQRLIWVTYGTFIGQALKMEPMKKGGYAMMIGWMIAVTFLGYSYKAVLLSFLTFPPLEDIRTIAQLASVVANQRYQCTSYPGTFIARVLASSAEPNIRTIGQDLLQNNGSQNFLSVLNNTKSEKTPVFVGGENHLIPLKAKYVISEDEFIPALLAVPVRKDFCCTTKLNKLMGYIWASGLYKKLIADAGFLTTLRSFVHSPHIVQEERKLTVEDFQGVFITLLLGYFLSVVTFIVEVIVYKFNSSRKFRRMPHKYHSQKKATLKMTRVNLTFKNTDGVFRTPFSVKTTGKFQKNSMTNT